MIRAMYNGTSGLLAAQQGLSTVSNNISNSQTTGFKKQTVEFTDVFYQSLKAPSAGNALVSGTNPSDVGNGVSVSTVKTDFSTGSIVAASGKLDTAIEGSGFYVLSDATGKNKVYTKAGNFTSSAKNELVTQQGLYVLGWMADPTTGNVNTTGEVGVIKVPVGEVGKPNQTTSIDMTGNLNREEKIGSITGGQIKTYDSLGVAHDVDLNFMKSSETEYTFAAVANDQFVESNNIKKAIFRPSAENMAQLQKGEYTISTAAGAAGMVDVTVTAPDGTVVFTDSITDNEQTVNIGDADGTWFTIDYQKGNHATSATVTVGEVGTIEFDAQGNVSNITGSGAGGTPEITFTPKETGNPMNITLDLSTMTSLATDNNILLKTDGYGSSTLTSYSITDGGQIQGEYNDGTTRVIGQIAMASFSNELGLSREGSGIYKVTPNSGEPDIGLPGTGQRSNIKAQAKENSNVDLAEEFVNLITMEKFYQGNSKVITISQNVLDTTIGLVR